MLAFELQTLMNGRIEQHAEFTSIEVMHQCCAWLSCSAAAVFGPNSCSGISLADMSYTMAGLSLDLKSASGTPPVGPCTLGSAPGLKGVDECVDVLGSPRPAARSSSGDGSESAVGALLSLRRMRSVQRAGVNQELARTRPELLLAPVS